MHNLGGFKNEGVKILDFPNFLDFLFLHNSFKFVQNVKNDIF